ncbi:MerR family transcriptional regulator [Naasia aerilata]|uniref:MerR family transcriptional regulator n=1 Tax=Naasia aerilata TaxID=1162966 RepID=A0ABN6XS06_9MICO|nr:TipAS antibiotic-recognition domain-containing protein [Naasia aerilata]BDZ46441.1 MerR family transcriptional regulator [Naasia aerilata]
MEWPISDLARASGTTTRALRHYGDLGLLQPSRVGPSGYRFYDQDGLLRLQRILLLRDLGLPLATIGEVLAGEQDAERALEVHLDLLKQERERLDRRIRSVTTTLAKRRGGEQMTANESFDGFDHTEYKEEVEQRWGKAAYRDSDAWWRAKSPEEKRAFQDAQLAIAADYGAAKQAGLAAEDDRVQAIAQRHYDWLSGIAGTPQRPQGGPTAEYFAGLGEMYVEDPRFTANYDMHGQGTAKLVRDAMRVYAERHLS